MNLSTKIILMLFSLSFMVSAHAKQDLDQVRYGAELVNDVNIFYREAGNPTKKTLVLLHGFPASSHQYREVLNQLAGEFYLIAPDYPGYGHSDAPPVDAYDYTFDNLATTMERFLSQRGISEYYLMIHDFGAPVGLRIAAANPDQVKGLIVMNGNAYEEGLSDAAVQFLSMARTSESEQVYRENLLSTEGIKMQYVKGAHNPEGINPDNWTLHADILSKPSFEAANLELLFDYINNVSQYPAWQSYMREHQPPTLVVWGKNDPFFLEAGAEAYKKDLRDIDFHYFNTGHFPLEEEADAIVNKMREFVVAN